MEDIPDSVLVENLNKVVLAVKWYLLSNLFGIACQYRTIPVFVVLHLYFIVISHQFTRFSLEILRRNHYKPVITDATSDNHVTIQNCIVQQLKHLHVLFYTLG